MTLSQLGENGLIDLLTAGWKNSPRVLTGVGDDCAVLTGRDPRHALLFKTDAVLETVHFTAATPGRLVGRKALARALSDVAAMGGSPRAAVITLGLPRNTSVRRIRDIYRGLGTFARQHQVDLVGGETTRSPVLFLNIALLGEMPGSLPVLRSGARPGDWLWVTGQLGNTRSRHHLSFTPRLTEGAWLAKQKIATAMMDLSDGLGSDLPRLARQSQVAFALDLPSLPRRRGATVKGALTNGEDYELLFTTRPSTGAPLAKRWPFPTRLTCIGHAIPLSHSGHSASFGYDHFQSS